MMEQLNSDYRQLVDVSLPYKGRQKYMHSFDLSQPKMADGFEDYLIPVTRLCEAAGAIVGIAHMTVDEKVIVAGMSQRRPKPHVDGCFIPKLNQWGGGGGGGWLHYCNDVGSSKVGRMAVIVAASVAGCKAWKGEFEGRPAADGDLSHIADQLKEGRLLEANVGFLLSPDCVHESIIFSEQVERTFLRIALPSEFEF